MSLVRPLDVNCRWNYIYFAVNGYTNTVCVQNLGEFDINQFMAIVNAYPQDFPKDIKDRLIRELASILKYEA